MIEARAKKYISQPGVSAQGGRSHKKTYILKMDNHNFSILETLYQVIEPERLYRVYAQNNDGYWDLVSMETLE